MTFIIIELGIFLLLEGLYGFFLQSRIHKLELLNMNYSSKILELEMEKENPSYNQCAKMWDICDEYACGSHIGGWTWDGAVEFIQEHWNDPDFNIDYVNTIENDN